MILIQLKLNLKKQQQQKKTKTSHFQMQLNQLHIQLHPILPNTFITQTTANLHLCSLCFVTTPPHMFSGMLYYVPL